MIILVAIFIGGFLGWRRAAKLGGDHRDRIQYAAVFALGFVALGLLATVFIARMT